MVAVGGAVLGEPIEPAGVNRPRREGRPVRWFSTAPRYLVTTDQKDEPTDG